MNTVNFNKKFVHTDRHVSFVQVFQNAGDDTLFCLIECKRKRNYAKYPVLAITKILIGKKAAQATNSKQNLIKMNLRRISGLVKTVPFIRVRFCTRMIIIHGK